MAIFNSKLLNYQRVSSLDFNENFLIDQQRIVETTNHSSCHSRSASSAIQSMLLCPGARESWTFQIHLPGTYSCGLCGWNLPLKPKNALVSRNQQKCAKLPMYLLHGRISHMSHLTIQSSRFDQATNFLSNSSLICGAWIPCPESKVPSGKPT